MAGTEIDDVSGTETTGHEWDGIKELNTPLPRWWLWTFYATIIWAIGYMIAYPAIPLISAATPGVLGYSSRAKVADAIDAAKAAQSTYLARIAELDLEAIRNDRELRDFAVRGGASAFKVNCIQCHGSGAAGARGYPNLNDDDWLWGGTLEDIHTTLSHGIRFAAAEDTRVSDMPAFGRDEILEPAEIGDVAAHVRGLAGLDHDAAAAARGAEIFADNCAACHGESGEGGREFGAPRLNDAIWLYGSGQADEIAGQIVQPNHGVMPAWQDRLDGATLKQLAIYVHSLGGGE
jgi:cytochrome c oxidase cbb3-type subunit 3